jgi:opacity protein-like surface antigen
MGIARSIATVIAILGLAGLATRARAADLYLTGDLGISKAQGSVSGFNSFANFAATGTGNDSSPVYGGALGMAFPLNGLVPLRMRVPSFAVPYWPGYELRFGGSEDFRMPAWETRVEIEGLSGRKFDFTTPGFTAQVPYRSSAESWSLMLKTRLDVPLNTPIQALFGRIPILEPLTIFAGVGLGASRNSLETSDTIVFGSSTNTAFAYQLTAGVGYALTERVHWSFGWRYLDLGSVRAGLSDGLVPRGDFATDLSAHELTTTLRFNFYHLPFWQGE